MPPMTNSALCWIWFNLIRFFQALLQITAETAFWGIGPSQGGPRRGASQRRGGEPHRLKEEILHRDRERRSKRAAHLAVPSERLKDWVGEQVNKGWGGGEEQTFELMSTESTEGQSGTQPEQGRTPLAQWQSPAVPVKGSPSKQQPWHMSVNRESGSPAELNSHLPVWVGRQGHKCIGPTPRQKWKQPAQRKLWLSLSRMLIFLPLLSYVNPPTSSSDTSQTLCILFTNLNKN